MKKLILAATLAMVSVSAQAGSSYSFQIEGQRVRINVPSNCLSLSCISVSAPGLKDDDASDRPAKTTSAAPAPAPKSASVTATPPAPTPAQQTVATPAPAGDNSTPASSSITYIPAPDLQAPVPSAEVARPAPQVATLAPATPAPLQTTPAAVQAASTPVGLWMTEKKEGKVRIEQCGDNLCGYSVNDKTNANGEQVLINMKPRDNKWSGRIHDTRGGGTYDSTIAMKGTDGLRVQGCAFGGLFCGGQTWTRIP